MDFLQGQEHIKIKTQKRRYSSPSLPFEIIAAALPCIISFPKRSILSESTLVNTLPLCNQNFQSYFFCHKGLVEQIHTEEDQSSCIAAYCSLSKPGCPYISQISKVVLSYLDARGPPFSRSLQTRLMDHEEFCMQVDSHVDVVQGKPAVTTLQIIYSLISFLSLFLFLSNYIIEPLNSSLGISFHFAYIVPILILLS